MKEDGRLVQQHVVINNDDPLRNSLRPRIGGILWSSCLSFLRLASAYNLQAEASSLARNLNDVSGLSYGGSLSRYAGRSCPHLGRNNDVLLVMTLFKNPRNHMQLFFSLRTFFRH